VQQFLARHRAVPKQISSKKGIEPQLFADIVRKIFSRYFLSLLLVLILFSHTETSVIVKIATGVGIAVVILGIGFGAWYLLKHEQSPRVRVRRY
jgi:hypothetical protein